jgi:hypothetical protein
MPKLGKGAAERFRISLPLFRRSSRRSRRPAWRGFPLRGMGANTDATVTLVCNFLET